MGGIAVGVTGWFRILDADELNFTATRVQSALGLIVLLLTGWLTQYRVRPGVIRGPIPLIDPVSFFGSKMACLLPGDIAGMAVFILCG
jgi:putative effector of murein hydrolase LrgA (UPF0299 family)